MGNAPDLNNTKLPESLMGNRAIAELKPTSTNRPLGISSLDGGQEADSLKSHKEVTAGLFVSKNERAEKTTPMTNKEEERVGAAVNTETMKVNFFRYRSSQKEERVSETATDIMLAQ